MAENKILDDNITLPENPGTRYLSEDELEHLKYITQPIHDSILTYELMHSASFKIAEMLRNEDVAFESALDFFKQVGFEKTIGKIEILLRIYNSDPEESINPLHEVLSNEMERKSALKLENKIQKAIQKPLHYGNLTKELGTDTYLILDKSKKSTFRETVKYNKKGELDPVETLVLEVCLEELTVFDSPISEEPRQFQAKFLVNGSYKPLIIGPGFAEEIVTTLKGGAYIANNRYGIDAVTNSLNLFIQRGLAEMKTDIENPGFFYNHETGTVISAKYDVDEPGKEELQLGLQVLEEFAGFFPDLEVKLATIFKWGLIAPFSFSIKQMGAGWMPWLFLYGQPKSGKSTLGQMILYMWGEPDDETNNLGGGSFDTEARIGGALSKTTFPVVVDEPGGVFAKEALIEIIKNAIMKKVVRSRYKVGHLGAVPSYSPVILTSNMFAPPDGAFNRRMLTLHFTHNEKKSEEDVARFEEMFQLDAPPRCRLNALKAITQAVAVELMADPKLLEKNWKEVADTLVRLIYLDASMDMPDWLMQWSKTETMEDIDNEQRESIRILLANKINQEIKRTPLVDEDYRPVERLTTVHVKSNDSFMAKVWYVVNEGLIPWMVPFHDSKKNKDYVCLTIGFKKELQKELKVCQPLKGTAELMGWKYLPVRLPEPVKVIKIEFSKFVDSLYHRGEN
ncbi:hypothetical protein [Methanobacterium sp.]|uniref:hypothetical protein n=1 Tax=Methanobacterium sp. TaxID=2164 RepID=UPI0031598AE5